MNTRSSKNLSTHDQFMQAAIEAARNGWGKTHPNPHVGAVIVEENEIVATGWHEKAGAEHAEPMALRELGRAPGPDTMMVVTLEPCSTHGKTPPCTERIIRSGLKKIIVGALDPNPAHQGRGIDLLIEAGLDVTTGVCADDCRDLNLLFHHQMEKQTPMLAAKVASTLDGKTATRTGRSQWITSNPARENAMHWRRYFPAIAVAAGTVLADNPRLTARSEGQPEICPIRYVFDRDLRTAHHADALHLYDDSFAREKTRVIHAPEASTEALEHLHQRGIQTRSLPHHAGRTCLDDFRAHLTESGLQGCLLEGGSQLLGHALQTEQIDYLFHILAPKILGDASASTPFQGRAPDKLTEAIQLHKTRWEIMTPDILCRGFLSASTPND